MKIVLIGAGNVATCMGLALQKCGHTVCQVVSKTLASARELAGKLGCSSAVFSEKIEADAELYIVAVVDDALGDVTRAVSSSNPNALFVHTSGSVSIDVWRGKAMRFGVFYPMQTFTKSRPVDFSEVSFFVEANREQDVVLLKTLAGQLGSKAYEITSAQRRILHIAAVFACNFTNHMYAVAARLMEKHDLPFESLLPLIDETARKVHHLAPVDAQTGPARRNDEKILAAHRAMLSDEPALAGLYELISKDIQDYEQNHK